MRRNKHDEELSPRSFLPNVFRAGRTRGQAPAEREPCRGRSELAARGDGSVVLVPHETAHQWFYSLVGNDQSRDPWLGEGLATWAQTGPESSLYQMLAEPIPPGVRNQIGEPMSFWQSRDFETIRLGMFVQTVQALAALGDPAKVDCALRQFVVRNAYRTAVPRDLLAALQPLLPGADKELRTRGAHF